MVSWSVKFSELAHSFSCNCSGWDNSLSMFDDWLMMLDDSFFVVTSSDRLCLMDGCCCWGNITSCCCCWSNIIGCCCCGNRGNIAGCSSGWGNIIRCCVPSSCTTFKVHSISSIWIVCCCVSGSCSNCSWTKSDWTTSLNSSCSGISGSCSSSCWTKGDRSPSLSSCYSSCIFCYGLIRIRSSCIFLVSKSSSSGASGPNIIRISTLKIKYPDVVKLTLGCMKNQILK